jgi:signal peptidase
MSEKTKKIINVVVDIVVVIVLAFAFILAISAITSKAKGYDGYTEIFGKAYVAVASDSMNGENDDNFSKGDLIAIKTLSEDDAKYLKEGDIITFHTNAITNDNTYVLNTHRIVKVLSVDGVAYKYYTHGDNNPDYDPDNIEQDPYCESVWVSQVVGVYTGKASGVGEVLLFMNSSAGFFTCIVLPSLLVVVYFAINLVVVVRKEKKAHNAQLAEDALLAKEEEKRKMREELLAELAAQNKDNNDDFPAA